MSAVLNHATKKTPSLLKEPTWDHNSLWMETFHQLQFLPFFFEYSAAFFCRFVVQFFSLMLQTEDLPHRALPTFLKTGSSHFAANYYQNGAIPALKSVHLFPAAVSRCSGMRGPLRSPPQPSPTSPLTAAIQPSIHPATPESLFIIIELHSWQPIKRDILFLTTCSSPLLRPILRHQSFSVTGAPKSFLTAP